MSLWNTFTSGIGATVKTLTGGASYLSPEEQEKARVLNATIKDGLASIDAKLSGTPIVGTVAGAGKKLTKGVGDLLLKGAIELNQEVLSPYIFRPISTAALLTDKDSPLYKKGEYEEGFQFSDIKAAYDRSAKVSAFQALTKSDLTPIQPFSSLILSTGKIDLDKVDLWNDESIKKNYVDNAVGRWFTGIGDFAVGNKALTLAGKATKVAVVKPVGTKIGLVTSQKTLADLATDMENGIAYAKSNGATGTQTISGNHMVTLAESKDWGTITDIVSKYSVNERLLPLIHDAKDADVVKDMILADKGDLVAMERLASANLAEMFDFGDVAGQLKSKYISTGKSYLPEGAAVPRLKAAYDAAIDNNKQYRKLRDAFFDEDYNLKIGGKAYMPKEPIFGRGTIIKTGEKIRTFKEGNRFREYGDDFNKSANFMEMNLGVPGRMAVKLVKWTRRQGEVAPLGFVTFSGMRPLDGRIELNAFLNNLKIFRDGNEMVEVKPGVRQKVGDLRREWENLYMRSIGKNEVEVLEDIDAQIGKILAYKHNWYDEKEIASHIAEFRKNVNTGLNSVKQIGYGVDYNGTGLIVDPVTLRQMAESYRFTPWDDIEDLMSMAAEPSAIKAAVKGGKSAAKETYRELTRLWTFNVLARPSYIIKQSIAEPIVSATLSQGLDFIWSDVLGISSKARAAAGGTIAGFRSAMIGRSFANYKNFRKGVFNRYVNPKSRAELKEVNAAVRDKQLMLTRAEVIKNTAQASLEDLLTNASPAAKAIHLKKARNNLATASKLLDEMELDLRAAVVPFGVKEAIPSMATLERRIAFLESRTPSKAAAAKLKEAKQAMAEYNNVINKLATNPKVIRDAEAAVLEAYKGIDNIVAELKPALQRQADVFGKSAEFKKRYFAPETQYRIVNGQYIAIDSFTSGPSPFSAAIRAETSNARTTDLNIMAETSVGIRKSLVEFKVPNTLISVSHPEYFNELSYIANRVMRQDPLMDLILAETPVSELARWATSDAGIAYMREFGVINPKQYESFIAERIGIVRRTFPTVEVRAAILQREVTAAELQKMLAGSVDELYDIIPSNYNYGATNLGGLKGIGQAVDKATSTVFRFMASAENPIRNALFDKIAINEVARRADILIQQGVEMTPARWNALRQSAGREAIQEMEKAVYTIRRPNRLLKNARFAVAFPTATVNAFYRYGRLAAKNPVGATIFTSNYGKMFANFGVDENGNPTNDMSKITHIIVPATKELGLGTFEEGIPLSARSIGFLLNVPSPSFITSISVGQIMKNFPGTEAGIKEALNMGGVDLFKLFYPYGAPTSVTEPFVPRQLKAAWIAATGPQGQKDYLASWTSVYNYHHMLYEMGIEKEFPSDKKIIQETKRLWQAKFLSGFISPAGVPYKVETSPMRMASNLYYKLVEKYTKEGKNIQDARDAAGDDMIGLLGPKFMVDRVSYSGSNKALSIPATYDSYKRVFEDNNELVQQLAQIDSNDIKVVALLTADLSRDPAERSDNILAILSDPNLKLPGTSKGINEYRLTPKEVEIERIKQRTWDQYNLVKDALEAKITDGKTLRSHPELKAVLDQTVETYFKNQSQAWYDDYKMAEFGDTSYKYARALSTITSNPKFMKANGNTDFWNDTKTFMQARDIFVTFYQSLPDYDPRKAVIKDGYNQWVEMTAKQWNPNLSSIIKTYFSNDNLKAVN
jgi:hypothetical protein